MNERALNERAIGDGSGAMHPTLHAESVVPVTAPLQKDGPFLPELTEVDPLVRAPDARRDFNVGGAGVTVAVLDTGLRSTHVDFAGRVVPGRNFTADGGHDRADVTDRNGHGTNVAGIVCAGRILPGSRRTRGSCRSRSCATTAPDGSRTSGTGWSGYSTTAPPSGSPGSACRCARSTDNRTTDTDMPGDSIGALPLQELADADVACCVNAGASTTHTAACRG